MLHRDHCVIIVTSLLHHNYIIVTSSFMFSTSLLHHHYITITSPLHHSYVIPATSHSEADQSARRTRSISLSSARETQELSPSRPTLPVGPYLPLPSEVSAPDSGSPPPLIS